MHESERSTASLELIHLVSPYETGKLILLWDKQPKHVSQPNSNDDALNLKLNICVHGRLAAAEAAAAETAARATAQAQEVQAAFRQYKALKGREVASLEARLAASRPAGTASAAAGKENSTAARQADALARCTSGQHVRPPGPITVEACPFNPA